MGLDMYMSRKIYIGGNYEHNEVTGTIDIQKKGQPIRITLNKVSEIVEQVGYWRKANAIHNWFVKNVQDGNDDCGEYEVSKQDVLKLLSECKKVMSSSKLVEGVIKNGEQLVGGVWVPIPEEGKNIENSEIAEKLLPTKSGFFFGGTDYDQYYYNDIKYTVELLEEIIAYEPADKDFFENSYYYSSSW